jgi:hypothetical protein
MPRTLRRSRAGRPPGLQLLDEPRLPQARLCDDLDGLAVPGSRLLEGFAQVAELRLTADQRRRGYASCVVSQRRADRERLHERGLALDGERLERLVREERVRPHQHVRGREDLARRRLSHHTRREVDAVALDGVRPAERRAEIACENTTAVHARPQWKRRLVVHDRANSPEHPLLVVAAARRCPCGEEDLPAVRGDVRLEERHLVSRALALSDADAFVERVGDRVAPALDQEVICAGEFDEADRDQPVLRLSPLREHVVADLRRQEPRQVELLDVDDRRRRGREVRCARDQHAGRLLGAEVAVVEVARGASADEDLAGIRGALHRDDPGARGTRDHELAMDVAGEKKVERAAVDADGHPERHRFSARADPPDLRDPPLHLDGGAARPRGMVVAAEEQQDGVAAPLDEPRSLDVGGGEQVGEAAVERVAHLLRADLPAAREALRQLREAGDVDKRDRALDRLPPGRRLIPDPVDEQPRHVRRE